MIRYQQIRQRICRVGDSDGKNKLRCRSIALSATCQGSTKKAMSGAKSRDLWQIDPRELKFMPGFNTRTPRPGLEAHIRALADSMKSEGYYLDKPIAVYIAREGDQEVKYVTDGHCRTKAVLLAIQEGAGDRNDSGGTGRTWRIRRI